MITIKQLINLQGRRALITGGAGNLGRIIASTLAELGADLILVDRPGTNWSSLEFELGMRRDVEVQLLEFDLEIEDQRQAMINSVKEDSRELNIVVNNAAFVGTSELEGWTGPLELQSISTWRRAIEVNLTATFHICQAFTEKLRVAAGANIINIGSIYGENGPDMTLYEGTGMGNPAAYASSKGGVLQLTRWLATTLAPNIRVNAISPGGILRGQNQLFIERYKKKTPMLRMATEDDFRGAIAFVASDMSQYFTGQNLIVDGGFSVW